MTFDAAQLDEFAGAFARALFAAYPEWVKYAELDIADDDETPDLVVRVPSTPSHDGSPELLVYTEDTEVTVCFGNYHSHFGWPPANPNIPADPLLTSDPLMLIAAIVNEEVAAVSGWNDEKWAGSWLIHKSEPIVPPNKMPAMKTIRVRSWRGTLNQDLPAS